MAWLDENQENIQLDFDVANAGAYVMIVTYHTPEETQSTRATVEITSNGRTNKGSVTFYDCSYSFLCRQVVIDPYGQVSMFELEPDYATAIIELEEEANIAIDNVALMPAYLWTMDYVTPQSACVKRDGSCIESEYSVVPDATKVSFLITFLF